MGMFDSFFNPGEGYKKGQEQLDKYYQEGQGYLKPYNQYGMDAYGDYSGAMKSLLDPASLEASWINSYSESPSAKNAEDIAQQHGMNAASSMGLMGSNSALNAVQGGTSQIALNDRQNYMNDLMNKYTMGVNTAGNIFNTGAGAAGAMANNAMNMGQSSAQMAYGQQNAGGDLFGKLLGTGVGVATGGIGKGGSSSGLSNWFI